MDDEAIPNQDDTEFLIVKINGSMAILSSVPDEDVARQEAEAHARKHTNADISIYRKVDTARFSPNVKWKGTRNG